MKKYYIIIITVLTIIILSLSAICYQRGKKISRFEKAAASYISYYNASERLYDTLEDAGVLEPYLESDEGSDYLKELNTIRQGNCLSRNLSDISYPAKLTVKK